VATMEGTVIMVGMDMVSNRVISKNLPRRRELLTTNKLLGGGTNGSLDLFENFRMNISHFKARALNKLHLLSRFNSTVGIRVNKKKFTIPMLGKQGYENLDLSEPWMTKVLIALRPLFNGHFVDVGVNLGQTLLKAHAVFNELNYIGFEPNPSCVNYVQELIRHNGFKKTILLPIAVGVKTEILKLNFFGANKSDSSATIIENFKQHTTLDHFVFIPVFDFHLVTNFLPGQPHSILKIDVEGSEMEVLFGLEEWVRTYSPLILLEILPVYSTENQSRLERQHQIEEMLKTWNYNIGRIKKNGAPSLELIERIGIHSNIEDCDYLLYHTSLGEKISSCFRTSASTA
jgi:FkbM family methyltransferase